MFKDLDLMSEIFPELLSLADWLPLIFFVLMGIAIVAYVILDGFDLGVGLLLTHGGDMQKDTMIASIGPFWDANETWLVLGVGILLVAFPMAHGLVLGKLYLPVSIMLVGLTLRGISFEFRVKGPAKSKARWNRTFFLGSLIASVAQGYMLGQLIIGFQNTLPGIVFSLFIGLCLASGYALLGACWLIAKTDNVLQRRAIKWAKQAVLLTFAGMVAVSIATPFLSAAIFIKWFDLNNLLLVWPVPACTLGLFIILWRSLSRLPVRLDQSNEYGVWVPFWCAIGIFALGFHGIAYSLFPWIVVDEITIWQAASAPESLKIILAGALIVLPMIIAYSVFVYRVFSGKAKPLTYY